MSMMKPLSALFLSLLVIISLAGCGSGGGSTASTDSSLPSSVTGGSTGGTTPAGGTTSTGGTASTGVVKLSWDPPQGAVAGINLHYGTSPGSYTSTIKAGMVSSYAVSGLAPGTYYFVVTAYDSAGNESVYSNEVQAVIPASS
ncbi:fibronectin type III domain-containing protein [Oryzomonas japonica]|uniref:Fibronectin type III domain-containing protein n=1 Tax=Oryzomonas japonica TaxID=2603858 RepID=A0A7J4ZMP9_9BACT|nr:fibronectin type III domain-containing protein [Oryzomonas japonica]KAB0664006.1 fibronectin type III domain-containing protein [Oryzomonas japonica]